MPPEPKQWTEPVQQQALQRLEKGLEEMQCSLSFRQQRQLIDYLMLMSRWNRAYNLTAIRTPLAMVERHVLDSLSIAPWVQAETVLDAGTGAGLPGIPLAVADHDKSFILADSNGKKIRFVREVVRQLQLVHVQPVQARLESLSAKSLRLGSSDIDIVCRALAPLAQLLEWSAEWLANGARLLAMKAELSDSERNAVPDDYNVQIVPAIQRDDTIANRSQRCLVIITRP